MHRLSFRPSARIAGPDLFMHLRRVAAQRTADFYFFYVDAGLVVFLNAIQTRLGQKGGHSALLTSQSGAIPFSAAMGWRSVTSVGFSGSKSHSQRGRPTIAAPSIARPGVWKQVLPGLSATRLGLASYLRPRGRPRKDNG
jgi:hypothetical protein